MKPLVFLVGFMGAGKTTLGKKLANKLQLPVFDLDTYIESKAGKSIAKIFAQDGEATFRTMESNYLGSLIEETNTTGAILSLGGGTPCFNNNMEIILKSGVAVYLNPPIGVTLSRIENTGNTRPLIANKSKEELRVYVENVLAERSKYYAQAQITFDSSKSSASDVNALCEAIITSAKK